MTVVLNSEIKFVEENESYLINFINSKFKFEDREQMLNIFKTKSYAPFVCKIIEDVKRSDEEKMDLLMHRLFSHFCLAIINGGMRQGKGISFASLIMYAKGNNPRKINYLKKFKIEGVVAFAPCPVMPFIDKYVLTIDQIPPRHIAYCNELAIIFGNTGKDYSSEQASKIPKEISLLGQKQTRFIGETQNDSKVNINFYKDITGEMFRFIGKKAKKFGREQSQDFNPLLPYIMPPSAKDLYNRTILENTTEIFYDDDEGFIRVKIPRTEMYTVEMSEGMANMWDLLEPVIVKSIKEDGEDFLEMKKLCELRGIERTPNQWNQFLKKHNIEADFKTPIKNKL